METEQVLWAVFIVLLPLLFSRCSLFFRWHCAHEIRGPFSHSRQISLSSDSLDKTKLEIFLNGEWKFLFHLIPRRILFQPNEETPFCNKSKNEFSHRRHQGGCCCGDVVEAGCMEIEFQGYWKKLIEWSVCSKGWSRLKPLIASGVK